MQITKRAIYKKEEGKEQKDGSRAFSRARVNRRIDGSEAGSDFSAKFTWVALLMTRPIAYRALSLCSRAISIKSGRRAKCLLLFVRFVLRAATADTLPRACNKCRARGLSACYRRITDDPRRHSQQRIYTLDRCICDFAPRRKVSQWTSVVSVYRCLCRS